MRVGLLALIAVSVDVALAVKHARVFNNTWLDGLLIPAAKPAVKTEATPQATLSPHTRLRSSSFPRLAKRDAEIASTSSSSLMRPPVAKKVPHTVLFGKVDEAYVQASGGDQRLANRGGNPMDPPRTLQDPYFWLRDDTRRDPEVLAHISAENEYAKASTEHLEALRKRLFEELKGHVKETDISLSRPKGDWEYYTRTEEGKSYSIHCRRPRYDDGIEKEEILLDENLLAAGHSYCSVSTLATSPEDDPQLLAYSVDFDGSETYAVYFQDLSKGKVLKEVLNGTDGTLVWGVDKSICYYITMDGAQRSSRLWQHKMGRPQSEDILLYSEDDPLFSVGIRKTRDEAMLFVSSSSGETTETRFLQLQQAGSQLTMLQPRVHGLRYDVAFRDEHFVIATNEGDAPNFKLVTAPLSSPGMKDWTPLLDKIGKTVMAHDLGRTLDYVTCFAEFCVCAGREEGMTQLWILEFESTSISKWHRIAWPEQAYDCSLDTNYESSVETIRVAFSSLVTPPAVFDYDIRTHKRTLLKQKEVPGYNPSLYTSARHEVQAQDGTMVPVTLLWRVDSVPCNSSGGTVPLKPTPLHLYGYGSYGSSMDPSFSIYRLPLIDRGIVYAIAHVRGGAEKGSWQWYEKGAKYLTKKNTFTDFVSVAEWLVEQRWTSPDKLSIEGASAGGLLVGNAANMAPHLFQAVLASVPFVDLMVTMCDATIPLTVLEWQEWGNPNEEKYFDYMLSYSPIQQVKKAPYPAMLIQAGLNDPRVPYWEAAKWAQVLRERRTNNDDSSAKVVLKTDMSSGHFSASDRYKYLKESAFEQAWLLEQLGRGEFSKIEHSIARTRCVSLISVLSTLAATLGSFVL